MPSQQNTFRNLYCNQWVSSESRWIDLTAWDDAPEPLEGQTCYVALDLSSTQDVTALACVFPHPDDTFTLKLFAWLPADNLRDRCQRDRVPYDEWARKGWLTLTAGNVIDYAAVEEKLRELREQYELREVAFDPCNASQLAQRLMSEGFLMVEFRQTLANFSEPTKSFEKLVLERKLAA